MAKKRTIDLENAEPLRDLPSSGVQVNYKNQTIIASDETCDYTLLTGDKVCEANIGVVYVKPDAPAYSITYAPNGIQPETGTPTSATAGEIVTVTYSIGAISNVNALTLRIRNNVGDEIPFNTYIDGSGDTHTLYLTWCMPAGNITVNVKERT